MSPLHTTDPILGAFTNIAKGEELITADGSGAFTVNYGIDSAYGPEDVVLSDYRVIPEPSPLLAVLLGGLGAFFFRRRTRAKA